MPAGYLVESVEGSNVRGWEVREAAGKKTVEIALLAAAKQREEFTLRLSRHGTVGQGDWREFDVPVVVVPGAVLDGGELTIRRSPLVELRTVGELERRRTETPRSAGRRRAVETAFGKDSSPSGIEPFQAYRFLKTPFRLRLAAGRQESAVSAKVYSLLKIAEYRRNVETQINLKVEGRPVHRVELVPPAGLTVEQVRGPRLVPVGRNAARRPSAADGLSDRRAGAATARWSWPARSVRRRGWNNSRPRCRCRSGASSAQRSRKTNWRCSPIRPSTSSRSNWAPVASGSAGGGSARLAERRAARVRRGWPCGPARGGMAGNLRVSLRKPEVTCETISNLRVTDRAVEETVLLEFAVRNAGIREVAFRLPAAMKGCRIQAPLLRQQTTTDEPDGRIRMVLSFQDEVMEQLRVTIERDRPLRERRTVRRADPRRGNLRAAPPLRVPAGGRPRRGRWSPSRPACNGWSASRASGGTSKASSPNGVTQAYW